MQRKKQKSFRVSENKKAKIYQIQVDEFIYFLKVTEV